MHVLKKALAFLREHNEAAFATVEDGKPKIRVFQIMRVVGPNLYFATAPHKEVYRQLQSNPNVEILAMAGNLSVRVTGRAVFPDFRQKSHFRCLKGSEVQDFRAFLL